MNSNRIRAILSALAAISVSLILPMLPIPVMARYSSEAQATIGKILDSNCTLERVERQYVRCDNLTGASVAAPQWLPEPQ